MDFSGMTFRSGTQESALYSEENQAGSSVLVMWEEFTFAIKESNSLSLLCDPALSGPVPSDCFPWKLASDAYPV